MKSKIPMMGRKMGEHGGYRDAFPRLPPTKEELEMPDKVISEAIMVASGRLGDE